MTRPVLTADISLGHVLTIISILISAGGGAAGITYSLGAMNARVTEVEAKTRQRSTTISLIRARLAEVERGAVRAEERWRALEASIDRIETYIREETRNER